MTLIGRLVAKSLAIFLMAEKSSDDDPLSTSHTQKLGWSDLARAAIQFRESALLSQFKTMTIKGRFRKSPEVPFKHSTESALVSPTKVTKCLGLK